MNGRVIRQFPNASYTGAPLVTQIGLERAVVFLSRPAGGGPICMLSVFAGDGRDLIPQTDLRFLGYDDYFAADVFVSSFDGTIKAFLNAKPRDGGGNDRHVVLLETGIVPVVTQG